MRQKFISDVYKKDAQSKQETIYFNDGNEEGKNKIKG